MGEPRFKDIVEAINYLEDEVLVTGVQGEAWDIVKQHLLAKRMCEAHEWTSAEIGALMMAATEAIDTAEKLGNNEGAIPNREQLAKWRAAVAREENKS